MSEHLPTMDMTDNPTGCCPRFVPGPWENKEFTLEGLKFIKASTKSFFYMPLNMTKVMTVTQKAIENSEAQPKDRYLMLSRDLTPWKADHYFLVTKDVAGFETLSLPGTFFSKVFEGPYSQMGQWYGSLTAALKEKGLNATEIYAFYTTCPGCAKVYGKNYVVLLAKISP